MINKKYLKNLRSKEINDKNTFFFDLYNLRIIDSLDLITLNFKNILILGDHGDSIYYYLKKRYKNSSISIFDFKKNFSKNILYQNIKILPNDYELPKLGDNKYDLIISNFFLNLFHSLESVFEIIHKSLIPNGFFVSTLPNNENFNTLKLAMIKTDDEIYKGTYNRFNFHYDLSQILDILKKIDFKIPLVNLEKINLEYKEFDQLLHDIRCMNLSYYNKDKKNTFEQKNYFKKVESNFDKNLRGKYKINTKFYLLSGWKEHHSQQKPLKPGELIN